MNEASRYSFNEAAGHYAGSDGEPCTADEVVAAHVYDALRARLAEAMGYEDFGKIPESRYQEARARLSERVEQAKKRAAAEGSAPHTETNQ